MHKACLFFLTLLLVSCGTERKFQEKLAINPTKPSDPDTVHIFQSGGNDLADIRLAMSSDKGFKLYMRILPQPMEDEEESIVESTGTWTEKEGWARLTFKENKPILDAVFDSNYATDNQFKVVDEKTVDVNVGLKEIYIWGVGCDKVQK